MLQFLVFQVKTKIKFYRFSVQIGIIKLILQTSMRSHPVNFGRTLRLLPYFICANSEGCRETTRMRRLALAFAGRLCDKYHNLMSWLKLFSNSGTFVRLWNSSLVLLFSLNNFFELEILLISICIYSKWGHTSTNYSIFLLFYDFIWAAIWQNQQNDCAPSDDTDQPGHPLSLIRVFAVRMKKAWVLSYSLSAQRSLRSDWADAQADLSLRWVYSHFLGFVVSRLICYLNNS